MTRSDADRDKLVSELMLDAGVPGDRCLLAALESIAGLSTLPAPTPRGDLAALLGTPNPDGGTNPEGDTNPDGDELAKRRRRKQRPALFAGAVVTAMGLGVGGVAASGGLEQNPPEFVNKLIQGWAPHANPVPQSLLPAGPLPDAPKVIAVPAPAGPAAPDSALPDSALPDSALPDSAGGISQVLVSPSSSGVPNHAWDPASREKPAATGKNAKTPSKAKPKGTANARRDKRPAGSAGPVTSVPAPSSGVAFKDSLEAVLDAHGMVGGSAVENVLRRIARLGIRV